MGKMTNLVHQARKYIGYDYQHFCNEFGGGCWAWCAAFVSTIGKESGNDEIIPRSTSCNEQIRVFKERGQWLGKTSDIQAGDIIYYDWDFLDEPLPADHVGIIAEVNDGMIKVIEGNMGDRDNSETTVGYRTVPKGYKYIFGIARPAYSEESSAPADSKIVTVEVRQLEEGMKGKDVEAMQAILIAKGYSCGTYGSDGDFGKKTKDAVKNLQSDRKIEVDGICGQQTWKELLRR
mgnify:CR=1 FL=1